MQVSSGARKLTEFRRRDGLLTKLYDQGRLDLLKALKDGRLTAAELVDADRRDRLPQAAADLIADRPLWPTVLDACDRMTSCGDGTRANYRKSWRALKASGVLREESRLSDLLLVNWRALEGRWGRSPAHWNHLHRAVSRTLTVLLESEVHPFRLAVMKEFPMRQEIDREPDFTPEAFWKVVGKLREHYRPFFVALATLGCRSGELVQLTKDDLMPLTTSIRIRRKVKNKWSPRVLPVDPSLYPWIERAVPVALRREWLREKWYQACDAAKVGRVRLHDLRHCHGQWTLDQGVADVDVQRYMGHATAYMTQRYRRRGERARNSQAIANVLGVPQPVTQPARKGK
jgi:integrase